MWNALDLLSIFLNDANGAIRFGVFIVELEFALAHFGTNNSFSKKMNEKKRPRLSSLQTPITADISVVFRGRGRTWRLLGAVLL